MGKTYRGLERIGNTASLKIEVNDGERTLLLPDAFANQTTIYTFVASEDIVLVSGTNTGIGLWEYNLKTNQSRQLITSGNTYDYSVFQMVDDNCFVCGRSAYVVRYNIKTGETHIYMRPNSTVSYAKAEQFTYFAPYLFTSMTSSNPTYVINTLTDDIAQVSTGGRNSIVTVQQYSDRFLVSYLYGGTWVWDSTTNTSVLVRSGRFQYIAKSGDTIFYSSDTGDSSNVGVWVYSYDTNELVQLYTSGFKWTYAFDLGDGNALLGSSDYNLGIGLLYYDSSQNTITQIYSEGRYWGAFSDAGDDVIIGGTGTGGTGLLTFNKVTKTCSVLYSSTKVYDTVLQLNDSILFGCIKGSGSSIQNGGILVYDKLEKTVTPALTVGGGFIFGLELQDVILISVTDKNTSARGLYTYDKAAKTITQAIAFGYGYDNYVVNGDLVEVSSSSSEFKLSYSISNKTVSNLRYVIGV